MWPLITQGLVRAGAECWLLTPGTGTRPIAEGIAGTAPAPYNYSSSMDQTYLSKLCEDGLQNVTVTRIYKKNVLLMFTDPNPTLQYLDQVVTPPAPPDLTVKWNVQYLVEKEEDACAAATVRGEAYHTAVETETFRS